MQQILFGAENEYAKSLKVMVVTFNLKGTCFENINEFEVLENLLQEKNAPHDMYVIATQEAERPIAQSLFNSNKERLNALLREYFKADGKSLHDI